MAVRQVSGTWDFEQNNGFTVTMQRLQQDPEVNGSARVSGDATTTGLFGKVSGTVSAFTFFFRIDWDRDEGPGSGGQYNGTFFVTDQNRAVLAGPTFDLDNFSSRADWRSKPPKTFGLT
jgi:hypothetical protein